jgi:hypothetical protein
MITHYLSVDGVNFQENGKGVQLSLGRQMNREMTDWACCPDCNSELNRLYAFERNGNRWTAWTHLLWHCSGCGIYVTPAALVTEMEFSTSRHRGENGS